MLILVKFTGACNERGKLGFASRFLAPAVVPWFLISMILQRTEVHLEAYLSRPQANVYTLMISARYLCIPYVLSSAPRDIQICLIPSKQLAE
jgi:hypothetical protein